MIWPVPDLSRSNSAIEIADDAAIPAIESASPNAGSVGGLLAYPLLVEPTLRLAEQSRAWTIGYLALLATLVACAARAWAAAAQSSRSVPARDLGPREPLDPEVPQVAAAPLAMTAGRVPGKRRQLRWIALAFIPSSYLLGVTTFITSDIANSHCQSGFSLAAYSMRLTSNHSEIAP